MANKFTLTFDANLKVDQFKQGLNEIEKALNELKISDAGSASLKKTFNSLTEQVRQFETLVNKGIDSKGSFNKLSGTTDKISTLFERLKIQLKDIGNLSDESIEKLFPSEVVKNIAAANSALKQYESTLKKINNQVSTKKGQITKKENSLIVAKQDQTEKRQALESSKKEEAAAKVKLAEAEARIKNRASIDDEAKALDTLKTKLADYKQKQENNKGTSKENYWAVRVKNLKDVIDDYESAGNAAQAATDKVNNATKELKASNTNVSDLEENIKKLKEELKLLESSSATDTAKKIDQLFKSFEENGIKVEGYERTIEGAKKALEDFSKTAAEDVRKSVKQTEGAFDTLDNAAKEASKDINDSNEALKEFDARAREINGLKSRIQYFFGLNNAIQLLRRTVRSAYQTITELDKAMTETAVVTNFSVSDMWSQLPEYTKNANALGVATLDAYRAATLYYQQGLKTNEVTALYNETLKMARIAGLDAAEATDRMTNALRGFNMELNETNAQRVDDVYSQLAAITASNVDEISTAMTKVASLAHNANMEFENTAAFLAQIIETTRESAETAGTALKTVVARFSEVKKLYSENELTGTDEEGEAIDVNKVAVALRSAGIDLNKYFLGEVGLDDIFIELASKWDSLTNIQQRYIATQAAGSRQQSRFIALMSDYARTQELTAAAFNANGAAAKQFAKTQDSLQSKLAKLKNAWNEFTMSITNSSLVKVGVDILTKLLNIVNDLTSGFGTLTEGVGGFINALAKIGLSAGLLKVFSVLANGGLATLSNIIKPGGASAKTAMLTSILGTDAVKKLSEEEIKNYSSKKMLGQAFISPFRGILNTRKEFLSKNARTYLSTKVGKDFTEIGDLTTSVPKTMFGAIGNKFISGGIGKTLSTKLASSALLGKLGLSGAFSGAVAGAATLGVALAAITPIAIGLGVAIKKIYDASPTGQLKAAEKLQDSINETYNALQNSNNSLKQSISLYHEQQEALKLTTYGTQEWAEALNDVNNTVLSIVEKFPVLAQYLTTGANGLMSLNEEGLKAYQGELESRLKEQAFIKMAAAGNVARKKAATLSGEDAAQQNRIATAQYRAALATQFGEQFSDEVINTFAENFDLNKWIQENRQKGVGFWNKNELRERYETLTGEKADEKWTAKELSEKLAALENLSIIEDEISKIYDFISQEDKTEEHELLNRIMSGDTTVSNSEEILNRLFGDNFFNNMEAWVKEYSEDYRGAEFVAFDELSEAQKAKRIQDYITATPDLNKQIKDSIEGYFDTTLDEINSVYKTNGMPDVIYTLLTNLMGISSEQQLQTENVQGIFDKTLTGIRKEYTQTTFEELAGKTAGELISPDLYYKIGDIFNQLSKFGASEIDLDIFKELSEGLSEEDLTSFYSIISSLGDLSDPKTIQKVFNELDKLGVNWDNISGFNGVERSADGLTQAFIKLSHAAGQVSFEELKQFSKDVASLKEDILEEGKRTFSEEEYEKYLKNSGLELTYTGIEGQEYVYAGPLDDIISILDAQLKLQEQAATEELNNKVTVGEEINRNQVLKQTLLTQSTLGSTSDYTAQYLTSATGYNFKGLTPEEIKNLASQLLSYANEDILSQNREQRDNLNAITGNPQAMQMSVTELQTNYENNAEYEKLLGAKFVLDDTALKAYDTILEDINEELKNAKLTDEERKKIAKELSLIYSEQAKKIDKINETIEKNKEGLESGDRISINEVAKSLSSMYGINEKSAKQVVENNKEALLEMQDDEEQYYAVLKALNDAWMQENAQAYNVYSSEFDSIAQQLNSIPSLDLYANLDTGPFNSSLASMFSDVKDFENYIATLGWAIDWQAYEGKEHTLETLLSGEMHLTRISGKGSGSYKSSGGGGGGGGGNSGWKNEQDRLYNLLQDIAEEQRKQTKLQEDYDKLVSDPNTTSQELIDNVAQQLKSLQLQYAQQATRQVERMRDIEEYGKENQAYKDYVWYNKEDSTVEYNWDLINSLKETDKEKYDEIVEIKEHFEWLEKDLDEAVDGQRDIKKTINDLKNIWRDTYIEFYNRVRDALIASYQQVIDNYSELNDTLNDTASEILQSLQDEISLQRQIRDNTKTEEDINEKEARLAYLRRDTTGRNDQEIRQLEKELDESRQSYEDNLVDQAINRLSDQNDKAAEQREHQIEIMQAQLDYSEKAGEFNEEVERLINEGIDKNGTPVQNSELVTLLQNNDVWKAMTEQEQDVWEEKLKTDTAQTVAFLQQNEKIPGIEQSLNEVFSGTDGLIQSINNAISGLGVNLDYTEALNQIAIALGTKLDVPDYQTAVDYSGSGGSGSGGIPTTSTLGEETTNKRQGWYILDAEGNQLVEEPYPSYERAQKDIEKGISTANDKYLEYSNIPGEYEKAKYFWKRLQLWKGAKAIQKFKTGGLNTITGPAWLDGTKSNPEYVLNADQTQAFLKLAEVLPQLLRAPTSTLNTKVAGDIYLDLVMNVDEIANDYDVDKIADRVKDIIYDSSTYRNVNVINFIK